jgi:DHA1 family tetracycline resistance protein-like MFS transporter
MHSSNVSEHTTVQERSMGPGRKTFAFLVVTVLLSSLGGTIFLPVMPFIAQEYTQNQGDLALVVGWLVTIYSLFQLLAAPMLGALSDHFGRRPLLLICLIGSAIGYALFGIGGALWVLFLSRAIDGLTGGNFSILFAYIGDTAPPEERGKYFGLFGALSGAGFIVGPAIGGFASKLGYAVPVYIALGLTVISVVWGYFYLPESLNKEHRSEQITLSQLNPLAQFRKLFAIAQLRWLLLAIFLFSLPFAILQANIAVLVKDSLNWDADTIGPIFSVVGVVDILMQGVLIGRLLPIFGEIKLTVGGLICAAGAYLLLGAIALIPSPVLVFGGVALFAVGTGLLEPSLSGLLSHAAGPRQQGIVQGGSQSIQSLAMIVGPLLGGILYMQINHAMPYWVGIGFVALAIIATFLAAPVVRTNQTTDQG